MQHVEDFFFLFLFFFLLYAKGTTRIDQGGFFGGAISPELLVNWSADCPVSYSFINWDQTEQRLMVIEM